MVNKKNIAQVYFPLFDQTSHCISFSLLVRFIDGMEEINLCMMQDLSH